MTEVSRTPDPLVFIREAVSDVAAYLEAWRNRRPIPEPDREARLSADLAVERIDNALHRLVVLRSELVAEIRQEDAARLALDDEAPRSGAVEMPEGGVYDSNADGFWNDDNGSEG